MSSCRSRVQPASPRQPAARSGSTWWRCAPIATLPILDDTPTLTLEAADPVETVAAARRAASAAAGNPGGAAGRGRGRVAGRRTRLAAGLAAGAQLSQPQPRKAEASIRCTRCSTSMPTVATRRLRATFSSIVRIDSRPVIERLQIDGPMCFGRGTEVTLHIDQSVLAGQSALLLSALLARLFARHAGINGFVRTRTQAVPETGGCAMADDARQSLPDLDGGRRKRPNCPRTSTSSSCCAGSEQRGGLFGHSGQAPIASRHGSASICGLSFAARDVAKIQARGIAGKAGPRRITVANLGPARARRTDAAASDALGPRSPVAALVRRR